jgi:hypothetical protein
MRRPLSNRRDSHLIDFDWDGVAFTAGYSLDAGGGLAELFISGPKIGSAAAALAMDGAILVSLALQHGADARELARSLSHTTLGAPASAIGAALDVALDDMANRE